MSTNANIGIERPDGTVLALFCKWDNYLDHTGRILLDQFADRRAVEALIAFGAPGTICNYVRTLRSDFRCHINCSQQRVRPLRAGRSREFSRYRFNESEEYVYLYTLQDEWLWAKYDSDFAPLTRPACDSSGHEPWKPNDVMEGAS